MLVLPLISLLLWIATSPGLSLSLSLFLPTYISVSRVSMSVIHYMTYPLRIAEGRTVEPTNLGVVLVHGYDLIDPDLASPTMRAKVENMFGLIAKGKLNWPLKSQF